MGIDLAPTELLTSKAKAAAPQTQQYGKHMNEVHTCVELLNRIEKGMPNPKALNCRENGGWRSISTIEFLNDVKYLVLGMHYLGMQRGDRVGILANPSPNWTIADLAIILAGGIAVPLFANISDDNFVYEVAETDMKIIFVEGQEQWDAFLRHQERFDVGIALGEAPQNSKIVSLKDIIEQGKVLEERRPHLYDKLKEAISPEDVGAIIYTSGSTGTPKGVELTQRNLTAALHFDRFNLDPQEDIYLSILPLAHVFGHCINYWAIAWGISIYYSNDYKNLGAICREVKPTTMVVVPRLLEKVYDKMIDNIHSSSWLKRQIGQWAIALAKSEKDYSFKHMFRSLADKLVYAKLREGLGGRLHTVLSGGAALNPHLHSFYQEIGIPIYEGWGLTEACPVCVNIPEKNKIGTVGPLMIEQKLTISPEGEVLVKGSLVMRGYYRHPQETAKAIDSEGWLHTGDRGSIDGDGYLTILGRMKELYKTSTGEYVAPIPIEQALTRNPLIDMAMVIADNRKFTSCLLFVNPETLARLKSQQRATKKSDQDFLQSSSIRNDIQKLIQSTNQHLNHWEQIHKYRLITDHLTIEGGELTPTMKIRREVVAKKYSKLIDSMYQEEGS